jgi:hypothetical protein
MTVGQRLYKAERPSRTVLVKPHRFLRAIFHSTNPCTLTAGAGGVPCTNVAEQDSAALIVTVATGVLPKAEHAPPQVENR